MRSCWRPTRRTEPSGSSAPSGRSSRRTPRSEEHTSELQSRSDLVCRLLLEKKKNNEHYVPIRHFMVACNILHHLVLAAIAHSHHTNDHPVLSVELGFTNLSMHLHWQESCEV